MKNRAFISIVIVACVLFIAWGCSNSASQRDEHHIKVGILTGPEFHMAEVAKEVAKKKFGLEVELVSFNDYVIPNEALSRGDIDVNAFQHKPYLDVQSKQRGYKLAIVGNTFVYPIAAYSRKIKNIEDLKRGSTVVIPNDPTNGGRSLLLLQKAGLIQLKDGVGLLPKVTDISGNPKNIKILELEAPQLPRALDDNEVTIAIINNNFAAQAGLQADRDGLIVEDRNSPYVNLIVAREDNKNDKKVKEFVQSYQSPEVEKAALEGFKGGAIKGW